MKNIKFSKAGGLLKGWARTERWSLMADACDSASAAGWSGWKNV